jgi:thiamine biosynthesis lipoprotein
VRVFHDSFFAMGTRLDLVIPDLGTEEGRLCAEKIRSEVRRLEGKLSRFDEASALSAINREAGTAPVAMDEEMTHVLTLCSQYSEATKGAFDITIGSLRDLWKDRNGSSSAPQPTSAEIARAMESTGTERMEIDAANRTVRLHHPDLNLDLGGFGKGYCLERIHGLLVESGSGNAFVSFGDSAVLACGRHPGGTHWDVGVKHLFDASRSVIPFRLSDESLSTSGNTPTHLGPPGSRFGHILSPMTGMPLAGLRTLSVVSSSAVEAEVLSTALSVIPTGEREEILAAFDGLRGVEFVYNEFNEPVLNWSVGSDTDT